MLRQQRNTKKRDATRQNTTVLSKRSRRQIGPTITRGHDQSNLTSSFAPPEDWYDPTNSLTDRYRIIVQQPGNGYRHVVTAHEIRQRLSLVPKQFLQMLDVVQLSTMTRKKRQFPCYGMQWGTTLYLYPVEASLTEYFSRPPKPAFKIEAEMYGGRWVQEGRCWKLVWTEAAVRDFYLNNILLHELGHLLDDRNTSYIDRERFAEWFALQFGYKSRQRKRTARQSKPRVRRRHHSKS